jgi:hypothetical protein
MKERWNIETVEICRKNAQGSGENAEPRELRQLHQTFRKLPILFELMAGYGHTVW